MNKLAVILSLLLASTGVVLAVEAGNATVDVTISAQTIVDITPTSMSWTGAGVTPGSQPDCPTSESGCTVDGYYGIEIENMGSTNVSEIWFNTSYPLSDPFGSGASGSYDSGNFIRISNETSSGYHFSNAKEFNVSRKPIYLITPSNTKATGRLRNGNLEYFWALAGTSDCNESSVSFYWSSTAHNETQTGDINLTDGGVAITTGVGDNTWGYADATIGGEDYRVHVPYDCTYVFFNHWDMSLADAGGNAVYFWDDDIKGINLTPGNSTPAYIRISVPYGVAQGSVTQGLLRVMVTTA